MKKLLLMLLLFPVFSFSQTTTWTLLINTGDDRNVSDIVEGENNNIYFTGLNRIAETCHFKGDVFKINYQGILTDSVFLENHDSSLIVTQILKDSNDKYILGVESFGLTSQYKKCGFSIKRIDTALQIISSSKNFLFPPEYNHIDLKMNLGINNNILAFGYVFPIGTPRMFIYELSMDFDSLQAKVYLGGGAILPMKLKQFINRNLWLIGELKPYYILVDSLLNLISKEQGRIPHDMNGSYGVKWDSDTSFYLAGDYFIDNPPTDHDIGFLHQSDPFDTTGYYFNYWAAIDTNDYPSFWGALDYKNKDSIFIGGTKNINIYNLKFASQPSWYVLLQTDSLLNIRWERFYGGDAYYNMTKLIATSDGGCLMAGTRFDYKAHPNIHERDIYIIKVNSEGLITSANGKPAPIVHDAIVYPNPGSNYLKVRIAVQHKQSVFKLFDMNGRLVLTKNIEGKTAQINTTLLKTGTYVYTITNNNGLNEKGKWVKN